MAAAVAFDWHVAGLSVVVIGLDKGLYSAAHCSGQDAFIIVVAYGRCKCLHVFAHHHSLPGVEGHTQQHEEHWVVDTQALVEMALHGLGDEADCLCMAVQC